MDVLWAVRMWDLHRTLKDGCIYIYEMRCGMKSSCVFISINGCYEGIDVYRAARLLGGMWWNEESKTHNWMRCDAMRYVEMYVRLLLMLACASSGCRALVWISTSVRIWWQNVFVCLEHRSQRISHLKLLMVAGKRISVLVLDVWRVMEVLKYWKHIWKYGSVISLAKDRRPSCRDLTVAFPFWERIERYNRLAMLVLYVVSYAKGSFDKAIDGWLVCV